jgi:hypothetical protein
MTGQHLNYIMLLITALSVWRWWRARRQGKNQRPAGWYPDPEAPLSSERYWNGRAWSDLPPRLR